MFKQLVKWILHPMTPLNKISSFLSSFLFCGEIGLKMIFFIVYILNMCLYCVRIYCIWIRLVWYITKRQIRQCVFILLLTRQHANSCCNPSITEQDLQWQRLPKLFMSSQHSRIRSPITQLSYTQTPDYPPQPGTAGPLASRAQNTGPTQGADNLRSLSNIRH